MEYLQHPNSHPSPESAPQLIKCPCCREIINVHYSTTAAPLLSRKRVYNKLHVSCSFRCGVIGAPDNILEHELHFCQKRPLR